MIPDHIIQKIKDRASTFEVIQLFSDISLKKEGVNYKACCPFHGEKTASFIVSPQKNRYKCYGCGASGNGIDFLMADQGLSFIDAIKALAAYYKIEIPNDGNSNAVQLRVINDKIVNEKPLSAEEVRIMEAENKKKIEQQVYHLKNTSCNESTKYLDGRGLNMEIITDSLYYQSQPYTSQKTGIQFPAAIAFLDSTETFINKRFIGALPENIGKSRNTGNMTNKVYDKTYISSQQDAFIYEGVINALSAYQLGKSALATFATSNEFSDASVLAKYLRGKNVILAFDPDKAGCIYVVKMAKFIYENHELIGFKKIWFHQLPEGKKDANDFLQEGRLEEFLNDRFYYILLNRNMIDKQYEDLQKARNEKDTEYRPIFHHTNLYNFENAKDAIEEKGECNIKTYGPELGKLAGNTIAFFPEYYEALFKLKDITKNLVFVGKMPYIIDPKTNKEPQIYEAFKRLVASGFNIKLKVKVENEYGDDYEEDESFLNYYIDELNDSIPMGDTIARTEAIKKAAEFMAMLDTSTYIVQYTSVYKKFNLNKADWKSIADGYLTKEKHKQIYSNAAEDDGPNMADLSDPHNLPAYVDRNDFYRKGYFAAQNREGKEVLYMFRSKEDGLFVASNFVINMIGHLYHNDNSKNKRIIRITDEYARDFFMEIESATIRSFNDFSNRIYNESNLFFFGSKRQYEVLLKHVSNNIPKWIELEILGQNKDDFFAFADGIYNYRDKKFLPINELGIVAYKNVTYYIPVFSSIYNKLNGNSEQFGGSKYLKYAKVKKGIEFNHTSFHDWTRLMKKVYEEDNTGMFAVIFCIMSAFRDFIYNQHRRFPLFFLSGPTNSGKSQVADSIQAPFAHGMQIYNLNSGTDAAFFVSLEKFKNIPMIFDEYNDVQISKIKFQGLKAGYDGVGKQKKKDVNSKELDMSDVNCAIVYLGQEIPEQDDYALFNRSLSFFIPLKDYSPEDTLVYDDLKKREEMGLTNILTDILNNREIIEKHYYRTQITIKDKLKKELQESNNKYIERILNSTSEYLAIFKIFLEHSDLSFAFDYETFYDAARHKCIRLSEMVQSANRLATFFQTITYLFNIGRILKGREFKIEERTDIKVRKSSNETEDLHFETKKIIFIRINLIYPMYRDIQKNESLKTSLLNTYIKDSPAFIGSAVNENFEWLERKIIEKVNKQTGEKFNTEDFVSSSIRNTTAIALDYDKLDLDLEKFVAENNNDSVTEAAGVEAFAEETDGLPF